MMAVKSNARRMLELDKEHRGFRNYLRYHQSFGELVEDLHRQFKFMGDMGAHHFLRTVGEERPSSEE